MSTTVFIKALISRANETYDKYDSYDNYDNFDEADLNTGVFTLASNDVVKVHLN